MNNEKVITEIIVKENRVGILRINNVDYISLTDLAKYQNSSDPSFTVKNWLRKITTIDYIGQYIMLILIWSNSTKLKMNMAKIHLQCHQVNGLKELMQ